MKNQKFRSRQRGVAIVTILMVTVILLIFGGALLTLVTSGGRQARRDESREVTLALADAGVQRILLEMWTPFRSTEKFTWADSAYTNASTAAPKGLLTASLNGGRYAVRVVGYSKPAGADSTYLRDVVIQSVGWLDVNGNGGSAPDAGEPTVAIEQKVRISLSRAHVFDYAYFVNNYGWMTGFTQNNLAVNGDMRANGNFTIDGGVVNGQVIAAANANLYNSTGSAWGATGAANVSNTANKSNTQYTVDNALNTRARQSYNSLVHGAKTSTNFAQWSDIIYDQTPDSTVSVSSDVMYGSVIADSTGTRQLSDNSRLDTTPTTTLPMPDLSNISYYRDSVSATYTDPKATYADGSANPDYGKEPYIEVYDTTKLKYVRVTGQGSDPKGALNGSVALIGTVAFPIKIHGPVTVTGDIAIKGYVSGQGTLYTGRNVHVIGDVKYSNPPAFTGTDPTAIDAANEKKTILALCAGGSVMMGNTQNFNNSSPLNYMAPPFTQDRRDDVTGAIIPAFNASATDTGYAMVDGSGTPKKYQSLLGDAFINANASAITQIDAVMYTNNTAGGLVGDGTATGFTINGSVISKDEAMVVNLGAGKMTLNYDSRIKERSLGSAPLIDINLPRTPNLLLTGWKEILP